MYIRVASSLPLIGLLSPLPGPLQLNNGPVRVPGLAAQALVAGQLSGLTSQADIIAASLPQSTLAALCKGQNSVNPLNVLLWKANLVSSALEGKKLTDILRVKCLAAQYGTGNSGLPPAPLPQAPPRQIQPVPEPQALQPSSTTEQSQYPQSDSQDGQSFYPQSPNPPTQQYDPSATDAIPYPQQSFLSDPETFPSSYPQAKKLSMSQGKASYKPMPWPVK